MSGTRASAYFRVAEDWIIEARDSMKNGQVTRSQLGVNSSL